MFFKYIILLPFISLLFPATYFNIASFVCSYTIVIKTSFFIGLISLKLIELKKHLIYLYRKTPFKYFVYFYIWVLISGLLNVINGHYSVSRFLYYCIFQLIFGCMSIYILTSFIFPKYLSLKFLIKFLVVSYYFLIFFGIMEFIGHLTNNSTLQTVNDFIVNARFYSDAIDYKPVIDRVKSTFAEPGWFGSFICFNLPIIYSITGSKFKIFQNHLLNKFTKITLIPFIWMSIILTRSPIWLIICLIVTFWFYIKNLISFVRKHIIVIVFIISFIMILCYFLSFNFNIEETYLNRIVRAIESINSIDNLVRNEASLGNRVICYAFTLLLFLKHPFIGVGLWNTGAHIMKTIDASKIPLTKELEFSYNYAWTNNSPVMSANSAIFYNTLADMGIIGFLLLYCFFIKSFLFCKNVAKSLIGIEQAFTKGVSLSILTIICTSIYDTYLTNVYIWFIISLSLSCYHQSQKIKFLGLQS